MPKINRIRIANISYGGKYILDQTINSFDGENVLINLHNGGGKSILTQMFLQPILPLQKVHKRNVDSYLTTQGPTFSMIEWKLDNKIRDTYFLTGIVIHKTVSDDTNETVKYFTFINEYQRANLFDISNIDFIINEEGFIKYKSYEYCLKTLREQERENSKIRVFSSDERKDYYEILEEHGIFKDEWKILAKTNEKEGGIDDMFEHCQTSDDVINNWVLKNISSNLTNSEKLNEMFSNLIESIIQKEDSIARKEVLDKFNSISTKYTEDVKIVVNNFADEIEIIKELEENYLKLQAYLSKKEDELQNIEKESEKIKEDLEHIDYEELSEEIYKLEYDLEQKEEVKEEKNKELCELEKRINEIKNEINILNAAKIYIKLKSEKEKLYIANKKKTELEVGKTSDERADLEYSLKIEYERELQKIEEEVNSLEINLNNIENNLKNNKKQEADIQLKINENEKCIGRLEKSIDDFKIFEDNVKQKLNLSRNIYGELDDKEINKILEDYKKYEEECFKIEEELKSNIKLEEENQEQYKENTKTLEKEIELENKELVNITRDYEEYKERETELIEALESVFIDKERLFNKEENLIEIKRILENVEKRSVENILILNRYREDKIKLENGEYHVDFEFGKILEKNKIQYETGESYLNSQPEDYAELLLKNNPMLPYSYIIFDEKDYEKIISIKINFSSNKVIPIIISKNIENLGVCDNKFLNVNNIFLACFYNKEVFGVDSRLKLIENLSNEIEYLEEARIHDKMEIEKLQAVITKIEKFEYLKDSKTNFEERINSVTEILENKKIKKEELEKNIDQSQKQVEALKNKILENSKNIEINREDKKEFEDFILKDKKYHDDLKEKNKIEKENINLNHQKESLIKNNDELNKEKEFNKNDKLNKEKRRDMIKCKYNEVENAKEAMILEFSLERLEEMYDNLKRNFSVTEKEILRNIEEASQKIEDYEKDLKKYSHIVGYEVKEYSEEKLDMYEEELEKKNKDFEKIKEEFYKINDEKVRIEGKLEVRKGSDLKKLKKDKPLEAKEIKGRYEERRKELKQKNSENGTKKVEINHYIDNIKKESMKISKHIEIEECENKNAGRELDISTFEIQQLNTSDLSKRLKEIKDVNFHAVSKLKKSYNDIYNENKEKDQAIDKILENMDPNNSKNDYDSYYFIYERTLDSLKLLRDMIQTINSDIMHIEDDKTNFKRHAYMQGKNIYLEMKSISDSTAIKVFGKSRKISLMEIILPKELDQFAEERVNEYIEKCILDLREESKRSENPKIIIEKKMKTLLSDRELLNKVINAESIDLKLYKIDINEENSGLKRWKDVIIENSGGEKVISCLILVLALMQYSRRKVLEKYGETENNEMSKILIIDNPFGKMSSPHLLNGLMMILEKFNVQAICLSDISQSSITNQFNLIYQMSLKTALYANNSYLTVDKIINDSNLKNNSALEHIFIKTQNQINLLE